jgi:C4-dicarboxylate-specific signal transduction histidine kinase
MQVIQYMSQTIDDFRNFFKPDKDKTVFHLVDAIQKTLSFVEPSMRYHNINIVVEAADDLTVNGYPNEYAQVLLNILSNAKDVFFSKGVASPLITIKAFRRKNKTIVTLRTMREAFPMRSWTEYSNLTLLQRNSAKALVWACICRKPLWKNTWAGS